MSTHNAIYQKLIKIESSLDDLERYNLAVFEEYMRLRTNGTFKNFKKEDLISGAIYYKQSLETLREIQQMVTDTKKFIKEEEKQKPNMK